MFKIRSLPAGEGDALWIEWGETSKPHKMIIDMGRARHGRAIYKEISNLPKASRKFELFIISHVDRDHIGGVLVFLDKPWLEGLEFKDIWFNGWAHLHGKKHTDSAPSYKRHGVRTIKRSALQGEKLKAWLDLSKHNWNQTFDQGPVIRPEGALDTPILLKGGMKVTILGPTKSLLYEFRKTWLEEIQKAIKDQRSDRPAHLTSKRFIRALNSFGKTTRSQKPKLRNLADLKKLARTPTKTDHSGANGSSISILLEYKGKRALLTGDAHADEIIESLNLIDKNNSVPFDLVKLPHHGSQKNITVELIKKMKCKKFLISTSGSYFKHPDPIAIARVIEGAKQSELFFNVPSEFNEWWNNPEWQSEFKYTTQYGTAIAGLVINL